MISLYLEGATPTRFGPRPRKSDRGPSFSRIDLKQNLKNSHELWKIPIYLTEFYSHTLCMLNSLYIYITAKVCVGIEDDSSRLQSSPVFQSCSTEMVLHKFWTQAKSPRQCSACHVSHIPTVFVNSLWVVTFILQMSVWSARGQEKGEGTTAISVSFCNAHSLSQAVLTHSTYFSLKPLHLFWNNDEFENTIAAVLQVKVVGGEGFNVREGFLACFAYIYIKACKCKNHCATALTHQFIIS